MFFFEMTSPGTTSAGENLGNKQKKVVNTAIRKREGTDSALMLMLFVDLEHDAYQVANGFLLVTFVLFAQEGQAALTLFTQSYDSHHRPNHGL
tara:strand:+ start:940 stop:1218 length:279 start_codon:yes stop_codon:yes gene_type:complete